MNMYIMGIDYSLHEVFDLVFVIILIMTLPIGITKQIYLSIKGSFSDTSDISPVNINKKTAQKRKKLKTK